MKEQKRKTRRLAVSAVLSAIGVVILYLGALIDVLDLSVAAMASLICVFAVLEMSSSWAWLIYAVVSILSLILLPQKSPAVLYAVFLGCYPILKAYYERLKPVASWIVKILHFNVGLTLMVVVINYLLMLPDLGYSFSLLLYGLGNVVFVVYDVALTRMISAYLHVLRARLRIKRL